jgi:hypothetical protein
VTSIHQISEVVAENSAIEATAVQHWIPPIASSPQTSDQVSR